MFIHKPMSITGERSAPLPLGLASCGQLLEYFGELTVRDNRCLKVQAKE
jgi:hypothetical protein